MVSNVSFPKIQIQSSVQPDGNHSFLRVNARWRLIRRNRLSAPSPSGLRSYVLVGPPGLRRIARTGRPALYVLLRSERGAPASQKNVKDRPAIRSPRLQIIKSSSPILINAYKLSHYPETRSLHEGTRRRFTSLPAAPSGSIIRMSDISRRASSPGDILRSLSSERAWAFYGSGWLALIVATSFTN